MDQVHRQSHFWPAFFFLPRDRRKALKILYAVCRVIDDAVDVGHPNVEAFLDAWRHLFSNKNCSKLEPFGYVSLGEQFLIISESLGIPLTVMTDLIDQGVAVDLKPHRFETPMDLERYCYGVAGTVGIACLPIFGVPVDVGRNFAIRLGIAVQWINIVRDVGFDASVGRIYLPLEHLELFGYTEHDLLQRKLSPEFIQLLNHEASVARSHYHRAMELLPESYTRSLVPARIMGRIYLDLLEKCSGQGFPVFEKKIRLNWVEKARATIVALIE